MGVTKNKTKTYSARAVTELTKLVQFPEQKATLSRILLQHPVLLENFEVLCGCFHFVCGACPIVNLFQTPKHRKCLIGNVLFILTWR